MSLGQSIRLYNITVSSCVKFTVLVDLKFEFGVIRARRVRIICKLASETRRDNKDTHRGRVVHREVWARIREPHKRRPELSGNRSRVRGIRIPRRWVGVDPIRFYRLTTQVLRKSFSITASRIPPSPSHRDAVRPLRSPETRWSLQHCRIRGNLESSRVIYRRGNHVTKAEEALSSRLRQRSVFPERKKILSVRTAKCLGG